MNPENTTKISKDNFPCIDCITYPMCRNKLLDSLKEYDFCAFIEEKLYYKTQQCFLPKCNIYKDYLLSSYNEYLNFEYKKCSIPRRYEFHLHIGSIIKQVFKIKES